MLAGDDAAGGGLAVAYREQDQAFVPVEAIPESLMSIPSFRQRQLKRARCWICIRTLLEQVIEVVGKKDRALRVPTADREQSVNRIDGLESVGSEYGLDVVRGLRNGQVRKLQRTSLAIERSLVLGEKRMHERRLAPSEHIRDGVAVMLDDGSHQAVDRIVGDEYVLELVEAHNREPSVNIVQGARYVEQLKQGGAGLIRGGLWRPRRHPQPNPPNRGTNLEAGGPATNAASRIGGELAIGSGDASGHIADCCHPREVNAYSAMAGLAHGGNMSFQETALAKASWCRKPDRNTIRRPLLQGIQLHPSIY